MVFQCPDGIVDRQPCRLADGVPIRAEVGAFQQDCGNRAAGIGRQTPRRLNGVAFCGVPVEGFKVVTDHRREMAVGGEPFHRWRIRRDGLEVAASQPLLRIGQHADAAGPAMTAGERRQRPQARRHEWNGQRLGERDLKRSKKSAGRAQDAGPPPFQRQERRAETGQQVRRRTVGGGGRIRERMVHPFIDHIAGKGVWIADIAGQSWKAGIQHCDAVNGAVRTSGQTVFILSDGAFVALKAAAFEN